ncbi:MAG: hypothetical protein LAO09_21395 [Acidobacteriia bacterium]|nr:hypothetical protein [Terriglobia bacterium]
MRYAKGSLVINAERDVPLLRQVRNSKFVSHHQLFEFMKLGGFDHSRNSFNWRLKRLIDSGHICICQGVYGAGSAVYRVTKDGLLLLEHHGQFTAVLNSNGDHLPHPSQVFHSLQLNAVQLALARANVLASWQTELEIASFNTISRAPYQKDYDAIVDVWVKERRARFALEYERTLKSLKQYERIRTALEAEQQIEFVLYLTSGMEVLIHLLREFQSVRKQVAFANASSFEQQLLDTVVTDRDGTAIKFWDLLQ